MSRACLGIGLHPEVSEARMGHGEDFTTIETGLGLDDLCAEYRDYKSILAHICLMPTACPAAAVGETGNGREREAQPKLGQWFQFLTAVLTNCRVDL